MKISAFLCGCVVHKGRDVGLFAVAPREQPGTVFHALIDRAWHPYKTTVEWPSMGMAGVLYPGAQDWLILGVGAEGQTWELEPASRAQRLGRIAPGLSGVTRASAFGDTLWICGMDRIVWSRDVSGRWSDRSAPSARLEEGVTGFTAIAAAPPGIAVAVGWRGEIWLLGKQGWELQDSGTNANFNAVSTGADGEIVAVADGGVLVAGRRDQWTVVPTGASFNLQGVCHFGGEVFVCSDFEIFRWQGDALVRETRFVDDDRPRTCMNMLPGADSVVSQGERDIFRFVNGVWSRVY
jgi:hypothetical protein